MPQLPQIHIRLPEPLHQHLTELADEYGISLNALVVMFLAGASGFKLQHQDR